ncbi:guanine nucleotide-binding protein-like protein [Novymonas esmeraldas]|uniref:Guanine nucleotide-binding protein-like protein n=1 Tax=Novymonas esmeraldas TaxID=1808958 RepID=A0AAW0F556_9TRYP
MDAAEANDDDVEADHLRQLASLATAQLTSSTHGPTTRPPASASGPSPPLDTRSSSSQEVMYVAYPRPVADVHAASAGGRVTASLLPTTRGGRQSELLRTYKVLLVGEAGVGKSNLMHRYCHGQYDPALPSTIGAEFCSREVDIPAGPVGAVETVVLQLWDTAGQERNAGVVSHAFYRNAVGAIIVYDVTRRESLVNVPRWAARVTELAREDCVCVVVGAKADLLDAAATVTSLSSPVSSLEALQREADHISHAMGMRNFMTSALSGRGVLEAFTHLVLAVDAVQAAPPPPPHSSGSSGGGGARWRGGVPMWTAAASVPVSPMGLMGGAEGQRHWPGVGRGVPSDLASSLTRAASTPAVDDRGGAASVAQWGHRRPLSLSPSGKKPLDLRGFGPANGAPSASAGTAGEPWGC